MKKLFRFYSLPLYICVRPFNGFYEMKFLGKGKMWIAFLNFFLLSVSISFSNQYSSVIVNQRYPLGLNSFWDLIILTTAVLLFCVSNWAVTSITDGEGKFHEIFMAFSYAMTPLVLTTVPMAIFSGFLTHEEAAFYHILNGIILFWFILLVFIGLVTIHNYSAAKALLTVFLTFVSLIVIVFLITLLFTLWFHLVTFAESVYTEIMFRP